MQLKKEIMRQAEATRNNNNTIIFFDYKNDNNPPTLIMGGSGLDLLKGVCLMLDQIDIGEDNETKFRLVRNALALNEQLDNTPEEIKTMITEKEFDAAAVKAGNIMLKNLGHKLMLAGMAYVKEMRKILFGSDVPTYKN